MRASDADREQFAERLRHAAAEGRLLAEELEERLGSVFSARTYGELDAVVADLPRASVAERRGPRAVAHLRSLPPIALVVLIPVALAMVVAAVVVVTALFTLWGLLVLIGWLAFGHRRAYYGGHYRRSLHACGRWRV
ncbi:MAG: DUF1707 domain-containing protein [Solirubrobacterales bacterium]|nr:DUF1707 domain-containing protein [Solirubrobacterales bacterium]